jgi:asparagine N-glycosylation enzyme membrane subunit Stt3
MSKREKRKIGQLVVLALLSGGLLVGLLTFRSAPVYAHTVPIPCDFTTGGGFVITDNGNHANFGLVAGCKHGGFFGHVNFVDHDTTGVFAGLHVSSDQITAYVDPFPTSRYRDICGTADTNLFGQVYFRVRTLDVAEPGSGPNGPDRFGIELTGISPPFTGAHAVVVSTRFLRGGNMQLHKPNNSTTGPNMTEDQITAACGGQTGDDLGQ